MIKSDESNINKTVDAKISPTLTSKSSFKNELFEINTDGLKWKNGFITREALLSILLND